MEKSRREELERRYRAGLAKHRTVLLATNQRGRIPVASIKTPIDAEQAYRVTQMRFKDANIRAKREGLKQEDALKIFEKVWKEKP